MFSGGILGDLAKNVAIGAGVSAGVYHFGSRALGVPSTLQETALVGVAAPLAGVYIAMQLDNTYDKTKQMAAASGAAAATSYAIGGQNVAKAGVAAVGAAAGSYAMSAVTK
jgi:hypothetical protein